VWSHLALNEKVRCLDIFDPPRVAAATASIYIHVNNAINESLYALECAPTCSSAAESPVLITMSGSLKMSDVVNIFYYDTPESNEIGPLTIHCMHTR
jgi:hypothetical protein